MIVTVAGTGNAQATTQSSRGMRSNREPVSRGSATNQLSGVTTSQTNIISASIIPDPPFT